MAPGGTHLPESLVQVKRDLALAPPPAALAIGQHPLVVAVFRVQLREGITCTPACCSSTRRVRRAAAVTCSVAIRPLVAFGGVGRFAAYGRLSRVRFAVGFGGLASWSTGMVQGFV